MQHWNLVGNSAAVAGDHIDHVSLMSTFIIGKNPKLNIIENNFIQLSSFN